MSPQSRLERYEQRTEWPLVAVALTFLALYSVRVLVQPHGGAEKALEVALIALFVVFLVDYVVRLSLAQPRAKWFFKHLWELPILLLPFLRPLRLLSLAVVINALQRAIGHTIRGRVLVYTACGAVAIVYAASLAILDVEGNRPAGRRGVDARRHHLAGKYHRDAGVLDCAASQRGGPREPGGDRGPDRGFARRGSAARRLRGRNWGRTRRTTERQ